MAGPWFAYVLSAALAWLPTADHGPQFARDIESNRVLLQRSSALFYYQRDVPRALERYVSPGYTQHNPAVADERNAAIGFLEPMSKRLILESATHRQSIWA